MHKLIMTLLMTGIYEHQECFLLAHSKHTFFTIFNNFSDSEIRIKSFYLLPGDFPMIIDFFAKKERVYCEQGNLGFSISPPRKKLTLLLKKALLNSKYCRNASGSLFSRMTSLMTGIYEH